MDWGEPSCWACNCFNGNLDISTKGLSGLNIFRVWNHHNYLQRCHIVPKALGGCNCQANLVLLCQRCHKTSPDSRDAIHFVNWVKNKKKIYPLEIKNLFDNLDYKAEHDDFKIFVSDEFRKYYKKNSVVVGGLPQLSTLLACFMEYRAMLFNKELSC